MIQMDNMNIPIRTLTQPEKDMRKIILAVKNGDPIPNHEDPNINYALYECCKNEYLLNIEYGKNANGHFTFHKTNPLVGNAGYLFLQETSRSRLILSNLFKLLKGTIGFLLGIIASIIAAVITNYLAGN